MMIALTFILTIIFSGVVFKIIHGSAWIILMVLLAAWWGINYDFFAAVARRMSIRSYPQIVLFTYLDALVMGTGIIIGFLTVLADSFTHKEGNELL